MQKKVSKDLWNKKDWREEMTNCASFFACPDLCLNKCPSAQAIGLVSLGIVIVVWFWMAYFYWRKFK